MKIPIKQNMRPTVPPKARGEVIGILTQMGKYLLQAEKAAQKSEEVRDES